MSLGFLCSLKNCQDELSRCQVHMSEIDNIFFKDNDIEFFVHDLLKKFSSMGILLSNWQHFPRFWFVDFRRNLKMLSLRFSSGVHLFRMNLSYPKAQLLVCFWNAICGLYILFYFDIICLS